MGGDRTLANWKFRVVKKMRHRAMEFESRARTHEEMRAWCEVQSWFEDILSHRHIAPSGAIGLHYNPERDGMEEQTGRFP